MTARLTYFPGSPFARMCRVLVAEWDLPVTGEMMAFPPGPEMFAINPLGQVPALILPERTLFPTAIILEELWRMAGRPAAAFDPASDRQMLFVILQATDAYAAYCYQSWAGLGPVGRNTVGYDPGARNLERVQSVLGWLDARLAQRRDDAEVTLCSVALACLALWADAREGLGWRAFPSVARIVTGLSDRPSFAATAPQAWTPDD